MFTNISSWINLLEIAGFDLLLSGDNAVVIALACRGLPADLQRQGIILGTIGAVLMRVVLTVFGFLLLGQPWLKLCGAVLLVWIAWKLMQPLSSDPHHAIRPSARLWTTVRTIVVADFIMSLDNVLAVAAAAKSDPVLIVLGIAISIPIVVFGSTVVLRLIDRWPALVVAGSALLAQVAVEMGLADTILPAWVAGARASAAAPWIAAAAMIAAGWWTHRARPAGSASHGVGSDGRFDGR